MGGMSAGRRREEPNGARAVSRRKRSVWRWLWSRPRRRFAGRLRRMAVGRFAHGYLVKYRGGDMAASIAFHALLYLFPLIGAILTVIGLIVQDDGRFGTIGATIVRIFPEDNWREPLRALIAARQNAGVFGLVSALGLFWLGSTFIASLARAFNAFYGLPERRALRQRLMALGLIVIVAVLLVATVAASSAATLLVTLSGDLLARLGLHLSLRGPATSLLALVTSLLTAFVLFTTIYWRIPNVPQRFGEVWRGATLAAVLLVAATQLFPLYVRFAPANPFGELLSIIFLLTTWLYALAHIILLGAALNAFHRGGRPMGQRRAPRRLPPAVAIGRWANGVRSALHERREPHA